MGRLKGKSKKKAQGTCPEIMDISKGDAYVVSHKVFKVLYVYNLYFESV